MGLCGEDGPVVQQVKTKTRGSSLERWEWEWEQEQDPEMKRMAEEMRLWYYHEERKSGRMRCEQRL